MLGNKRVLAVIPARAGSKRLPNKNIKSFAGAPLICWTVKAALGSKVIDHVVVTSDSEEILRISATGVTARQANRFATIKRQASLSTDDAGSEAVAIDVLDRYPEYELLVWLQPTSPLRDTVLIDEAFAFYQRASASSLVSVTELSHPASWINTLDERGALSKFYATIERQEEVPESLVSYQLNGALYIIECKQLKEQKRFLNSDSLAFPVNPERAVDIDTFLDFQFAECLHKEYPHRKS